MTKPPRTVTTLIRSMSGKAVGLTDVEKAAKAALKRLRKGKK